MVAERRVVVIGEDLWASRLTVLHLDQSLHGNAHWLLEIENGNAMNDATVETRTLPQQQNERQTHIAGFTIWMCA